MPRARVRAPGRTQKKRQRRVRGCVSPGGRKRNDNAACSGAGPGEAVRSKQALLLSGRRCAAGSFARNGRVSARRRTRRFGHAALASCSVSAPRRTTRRQCRVRLGFHRAAGGEKPAEAPAFRPRADAKETATPRAAGPGRAKRFGQNRPFYCPGGAVLRAVLRGVGRVSARRRTRRFGHAALTPCSVFAPRRTTRRQRRVWLGFHCAAGREEQAEAPTFRLPAPPKQKAPPPPGRREAALCRLFYSSSAPTRPFHSRK